MKYKYEYFSNKSRKGSPKEVKYYDNRYWRSRWERQKDLSKNNPNADKITKIYTKGTKKDYVFQKAYGVAPNGDYIKITPVKGSSKKSYGSSSGFLQNHCRSNGKGCSRCMWNKLHLCGNSIP